MKRALSFALTLILIFNRVGASCIAKSTEPLQSESTQIESQAKVNLSSKDEVLQKVVEQVLAELKKREEAKSDASKNEKQNNSCLPVRILKTLFKPVHWIGKAGVFVVKQFLWLILGALMGIIGSIVTTYTIFKTGGAGLEKAEGPIKNIIDKAEQATKNIVDDPNTAEFLKQINDLKIYETIKEIPLLDIGKTMESSLEEMNKLIEHLKENPQLAEGILSHMFSLLSNCEESMQPDEFKSYLRKVALLFHPDKLKNLRNISEEDANRIYQLTTELMNKK